MTTIRVCALSRVQMYKNNDKNNCIWLKCTSAQILLPTRTVSHVLHCRNNAVRSAARFVGDRAGGVDTFSEKQNCTRLTKIRVFAHVKNNITILIIIRGIVNTCYYLVTPIKRNISNGTRLGGV